MNRNLESDTAFSQSALLSTINNFTYCPEENPMFETYFRRYEDLYNIDCGNLADQKKSPFVTQQIRGYGTRQIRRLYLATKD